jgi:hypothetical protein
MGTFAVLDTETVWGSSGLLSLGLIVFEASGQGVSELGSWFWFSSEHNSGMYYDAQKKYAKKNKVPRTDRDTIEQELSSVIGGYKVKTAYAYNASFDQAVVGESLPSIRVKFRDLMHPARRVLAGKEHFPAYSRVHPGARVTGTGVLGCCYKADDVGRYLGLPPETHVAIEDAWLEAEIAMKLGLFEI